MRKILIFGNSGSGKSTLAKQLGDAENLARLDLDTIAWLPTNVPQRAPLSVAGKAIEAFTSAHDQWVIEGCYTDLLEMVASEASEIIFMNLTPSLCIENARNRPWEPHKYASKKAQDDNLPMLIDWIKQYPVRNGIFSYSTHCHFYRTFHGKKTTYLSNDRTI